MFIERLKIHGFRALYDAEVEPGLFTVLAGANNAGKTTLADALDFLAEVHRFSLEVALSRNGGFENVAFRRMRRTRRPVELEVQVSLSPRELRQLVAPRLRAERKHIDGAAVITHRFSFKAASAAIAADFSVVDELISIDYRRPNGATKNLVKIERVGSETKIARAAAPPKGTRFIPEYEYEVFLDEKPDETVLLTDALGFTPLIRQFRRALMGSRIFQISPLELRRPGVPTPNPALERYGENLPALVNFFRNKGPQEAWEQVFNAMQQIVPNLEDIDTDFSADRRLVLRFHEAGVGRPWNANEISDGTIQSLALFCALFDPRITLAFIEEPENSVHPWIVRVFSEACRSAARAGKQIVVTTHSPAMLKSAQPSEVKLIWRRDGRSHIAPLLDLDPEAEGLWETGTVDVFELLDSGALREAVPEGSA
jgi:predicted ATPase